MTGTAGQARDDFLTVLRALATISVTIVHLGYQMIGPEGNTLVPKWGLPELLGLPWLTWLFVWMMPTFFFVAGAVSIHAGSGGRYRRKRLVRLLVPYGTYCAAYAAAISVSWAVASPQCGGHVAPWGAFTTWLPLSPLDCLRLGSQHTWFLAVFVPMSLAAPVIIRWAGTLRAQLSVMAACAGLVGIGDLVRSRLGAGYFAVGPLAVLVALGATFGFWLFFYVGGLAYRSLSLSKACAPAESHEPHCGALRY